MVSLFRVLRCQRKSRSQKQGNNSTCSNTSGRNSAACRCTWSFLPLEPPRTNQGNPFPRSWRALRLSPRHCCIFSLTSRRLSADVPSLMSLEIPGNSRSDDMFGWMRSMPPFRVLNCMIQIYLEEEGCLPGAKLPFYAFDTLDPKYLCTVHS